MNIRHCIVCQKYFIPKNRKRKYCYEKECAIEYERMRKRLEYNRKKHNLHRHPYPYIREYTDTTELIVAMYYMDGFSPLYIANELKRDYEDFSKFFNHMISSGKMKKIIEMIEKNRKKGVVLPVSLKERLI